MTCTLARGQLHVPALLRPVASEAPHRACLAVASTIPRSRQACAFFGSAASTGCAARPRAEAWPRRVQVNHRLDAICLGSTASGVAETGSSTGSISSKPAPGRAATGPDQAGRRHSRIPSPAPGDRASRPKPCFSAQRLRLIQLQGLRDEEIVKARNSDSGRSPSINRASWPLITFTAGIAEMPK